MPLKVDPLRLFLQKYHTRKYSKGELILVQGETPECAYIVRKGVIKTYNLTSQGEEKPISFDIQGELFPLAWVFGRVSGAPYYYEAFTDCELYCVPREDYRQFIQHNTSRMSAVLDRFVEEYLTTQLRVNALEQSKAAAKILYTIYYLCVRFGVDVKKNVVRIQLPLTQQDLANFIGLTRETTGIELKKMQKSGLLTYRKQNYIIRTDLLNSMLDEEYGHAMLKRRQIIVRL